MTATTARRTGGGKKIRDRQRLAHLVAGVTLVAYLYLPGDPSPALETAVRWVILPVLAGVRCVDVALAEAPALIHNLETDAE